MNIKYGVISSIQSGRVQVYFEEDKLLSDELILLNYEYLPPKIGDEVVCLIPEEGKGICLKGYFNKDNLPESNVKYRKQLSNDILITVDENCLLINANTIKIVGDVTITGNVNVIGTIDATGSIKSGGVVLT